MGLAVDLIEYDRQYDGIFKSLLGRTVVVEDLDCGIALSLIHIWNMVYGNTPEEVRKDGEGLQTMRTLGRNMAFLMKSIQLGREQFGIPEKEPIIVTSFHHE